MKTKALAGIAGVALGAALVMAHVAGCATNDATDPTPIHKQEFYAKLPVPDFASGATLDHFLHVDAAQYDGELVLADLGVGKTIDEVARNRYSLSLKASHDIEDSYVIEHAATSTRFSVWQTADRQTYVFRAGGADYPIESARSLVTDAVKDIPREHRQQFAVMLALTAAATKIDQQFFGENPEQPVQRCQPRTRIVDGEEVPVEEEIELGCCLLEEEVPEPTPETEETGDGVAFTDPPPPSWWRRTGRLVKRAGVAGAVCLAGVCGLELVRGTQCDANKNCNTVWCNPFGACPNQCPNGNPDCNR